MLSRLDGSPVELPYVDRLSPRFRLAMFLEWCEERPERIHQVAAAILSQNGFDSNQIHILREIPDVELTKPTEFWNRFDRIEADKPRGYIQNVVFKTICQQWVIESWDHEQGRRTNRQRLRQIAALILCENGFTTTQVASVLGWKAKGSATRAMQSAREQLSRIFDLN